MKVKHITFLVVYFVLLLIVVLVALFDNLCIRLCTRRSSSNQNDNVESIRVKQSKRQREKRHRIKAAKKNQRQRDREAVSRDPSAPSVLDDLLSILSWAMLAASTVGPGSVVVCSKAGADFDLKLLWCLIVASAVAYILQENSARLCIETGLNFGEAIRACWGNGAKAHTPLIAYLCAIGIFVGNTMYQANIFVGGITALYALHENTDEFRYACSSALGASLLLIIFCGDVDTISVGLGLVVLVMATMFAVSAGEIGVDFVALGEGLQPSVPENSAILALSMIGTTALPYNLFLASSIASKNTVASMQRGLAFSTTIAAIASTLIVIVGSAVTEPAEMEFSIADLQQVLRTSVGDEAVIAFSLGLLAAAFSAALGVALGAGLTLQSLLSNGMGFGGDEESGGVCVGREAGRGRSGSATGKVDEQLQLLRNDVAQAERSQVEARVDPGWEAGDRVLYTPNGSGGSGGAINSESSSSSSSSSNSSSSSELVTIVRVHREDVELYYTIHLPSTDRERQTTLSKLCAPAPKGAGRSGVGGRWAKSGWRFRGVVTFITAAGVGAVCADLDCVPVVVAAQVVNGLLLPCLAVCLFYCVNDPRLMNQPRLDNDHSSDDDDMDSGGVLAIAEAEGKVPEQRKLQTPAANVLLLLAVGVTIFLANMTILPFAEIAHPSLRMSNAANIRVSGILTAVFVLILAAGLIWPPKHVDSAGGGRNRLGGGGRVGARSGVQGGGMRAGEVLELGGAQPLLEQWDDNLPDGLEDGNMLLVADLDVAGTGEGQFLM
jgi:Mn2+/Fe2+ NRAMP family transporter